MGLKKLQIRMLLLLTCLVIGWGNAWGADGDTHDFSQSLQQLLNNNASISSINIAEQSYAVKKVIVSYRYNKTITNAVTVEVSVGGNSWGSQNVVGTGSDYSTLEFPCDNATTGAIVISFTNNTGSGTGHGTFYVNNVQLVEGVVDSRTAIATIGDLTPTEIPFDGEGSFTLGITDAASTYTVSYASGDNDMLVIDGSTYRAGSTKGNVTVTATVTPTDAVTYKPVSKEFTVNVYNPNAGDGTKERPFSVAEALENTPASGTSSDYYIKGIVSKFHGESIVDDGTNYRYYISDDGTETDELLVYRGKNIGNVAFSSADDLKVGDLVVIYGGLTTYSTTKEIASGNYIYSLNGKKLAGISYETTAYNSLPGNVDFETPTLTNPNSVTVTYSTDNAEIAAVNASTGVVTIGTKEGTATITASFAGNESYFAATATYTITTARADADISFAETSVTLTKGDEFSAPAFNNPNSLTGIVFTSSYEGVATVSDAGVISLGGNTGTAIIKATYAQSVQYNAGEATCTITVNPSGVTPEPSAAGYYQKVTATADITDGDYLIVYEDDNVALNGNLASSGIDVSNNTIGVSISDNKITSTDDTRNAEFSIAAVDGGYSVQSKSKSYYIYHSGSNNTLNTSESSQVNTITIEDGYAVIAVGTYHIRYNASSGQERFRYYTTAANVQLYKYVAGANPDNIDIYVSEAGMATYASNFALDFTDVENLKAYIATEDGSTVTYSQVYKVPAGTGVLLSVSDGGGKNYTVPTTSEDTDDVTGNLFQRGTGAAVASNDGAGNYNYILNVVDNQIGFYRANSQTVDTNRAYMQTTINAAASARGFIAINFDEEGVTTGIKIVESREPSVENYYDLQGRRVEKPVKGLYIVNGKKVFVK